MKALAKTDLLQEVLWWAVAKCCIGQNFKIYAFFSYLRFLQTDIGVVGCSLKALAKKDLLQEV